MQLPVKKHEPGIRLDRLKVLIYGKTNTGKSTFCSRAEDVCIIPFDSTVEHIEGYHCDLVTEWADLLQAVKLLQAGGHGFKNVCVDNLGVALDLCKQAVCKKHKVEHESDIPGFAKGHSLVNNEFRRFIIDITNLPMGVYFGCHDKEEKVKTRSAEFVKIVPDLSPAAREIVLRTCEFVLHTRKETIYGENGEKSTRRYMWTQGDDYEYEAKDRTTYLPHELPVNYKVFMREVQTAWAKKQADMLGASNQRQSDIETHPSQNKAVASNGVDKPDDKTGTTKASSTEETKTSTEQDKKGQATATSKATETKEKK